MCIRDRWRTKATAFLYTNAGVSGKIFKKISFVTATKRIKYLGIILTKDVKNLHMGSHKALLKEIEEHNEMERYFVSMGWKNPPS